MKKKIIFFGSIGVVLALILVMFTGALKFNADGDKQEPPVLLSFWDKLKLWFYNLIGKPAKVAACGNQKLNFAGVQDGFINGMLVGWAIIGVMILIKGVPLAKFILSVSNKSSNIGRAISS